MISKYYSINTFQYYNIELSKHYNTKAFMNINIVV